MRLETLTVHELDELLNKKEISYSDITEAVVKSIDDKEIKVDSYLTLTTEAALERAKQFDKSGEERTSPLFGVPYALKDNMCTNGIRTTCASKILANFEPVYNADVYDRLNIAGGNLLGKVNMDEFAMGSSNENSAFKITKNPWNLTKVPGGSSGGCAAAIASDMAYFTLGSDTGGSIRQPSAFCGVVGLKPTYGLVSRYGVVAFASSLDQVGPITKDVEDSAIVLNAIAGHDPKDSTSLNKPKIDYTVNLKKGVKGLRIGIAKAFMGEGLQKEVRDAIEDAKKVYTDLGAEIVDVSFEYLDYSFSSYYLISSAEASSNLARYDGIHYGERAEEYSDLIDMYIKTRTQGFGKEVKRRIMLGTYALSTGYYDAYYKKAMQIRTLIVNDFKQTFKECDILLTPTTAKTAFGLGEKSNDLLEMYLTDIYTVPTNLAGIPGISIPCGFDKAGMPIGMQLLGPVLSEEKLLQTAYAFEQATKHHLQKPNLK